MNTIPQHKIFSEFSGQMDILLLSSSPLLNEPLLLQYQAMDEGVTDDPLLPRLVSIFENQMPEHLKRLNLSLQEQDEAEVTYVIHKMLGMTHNVGALRLSDILMVLENSEKDTRMRLSGADVTLLVQEFEAAVAALQEYMDQAQ